MHSRGDGRVCILAALCLTTLILFLKINNGHLHELFSKRYTGAGQGVGNSTLGFEVIFAINAPWRTDRKDSLTLAAAHTGITIEWINGVNASSIDHRAYPQGDHRLMPKGNLGSWRAHIDTIRTIVEGNLSTALILEDDVDWDPRVREQLSAFGRASYKLPDMIAKAELAARERVPSSNTAAHQESDFDARELAKRSTLPLPSWSPPSSEPYGDNWDILWLGHCSNSLPPPQNSSSPILPPSRLMLLNDPTIPTPETSLSSPPVRIYHRTHLNLCTLAYAVTQRGARKILYEHGIRNLDKGYDFALSEWCDGETKHMGAQPLCLTSSPGVFGHWWGGGGGRSDVSGVGRDGVGRGTGRLVKSVRDADL